MANFRLLYLFDNEFFSVDEIEQRGYLNAVIEINGQHFYEVVFHTFEAVDYVRRSGGQFFAEAGMILVSGLTEPIMRAAIEELYERSTFFRDSKEQPSRRYKECRPAVLK